MVRFHISTLVLALNVSADLHNMKAILDHLLQNTTVQNRALTNSLYNANFQPYGCWCNFDSSYYNSKNGKGSPVDAWDSNCKNLKKGYDCVILDAADAGDLTCEPWTETYDIVLPQLESIHLLEGTCSLTIDSATEVCKYNTCLVETYYVAVVAEWILRDANAGETNWLIDTVNSEENLHANGFVQSDECVSTKGTQSPIECCGIYPSRYPFRTFYKCCDSTNKLQQAGTC